MKRDCAITCMCESHGPSRQYSFQTTFKIRLALVRPTRMSANVLPHDVDHRRSDQAVLDYEREEIRCRVLHDGSHNIDASA